MKTIGHKMENAHVKLGSKIHIRDFYFAEKVFQNSFYARRFAYLIVNDILEKRKKDAKAKTTEEEKFNNTIIIGYGIYSDMLVRDLIHFLVLSTKKVDKLKGFIIRDVETLELVNKREFKDTVDAIQGDVEIILIVPIGSTLTTSAKIMHKLQSLVPDRNIVLFDEKAYTIVVVGPGEIQDVKQYLECKETDLNMVKKRELAIAKKFWKKIDMIEQSIDTKLNVTERYFIYLASEWYEPHSCKMCFPKNFTDEFPLLITDKVSVMPETILQRPSDKESLKKNDCFNLINDDSKIDNIIQPEDIKYGHYASGHNHYLFYLKTGKIAQKKEVDKLIECLKSDINPPNLQNNKTRVLLAPAHDHNIDFIMKVNRFIFNNSGVIIRFDPFINYRDNFLKFYSYLREHDKFELYYVDDTLASAKTFTMFENLILSLYERKVEASSNNDFAGLSQISPIKYIITLVNRLSGGREKALLNRGISIYSVFNIYLPVLRDPDKLCYMCKEVEYFREMFDVTLLDLLQIKIEGKVGKLELKNNLSQIKDAEEKHFTRLKTIHSLLKLMSIKENNNVEEIFELLRQKLKGRKNKLDKINFLKATSSDAVIMYKDVKKVVFKILLNELKQVINDGKMGNIKETMENFLLLIFLMKKLTHLRSNVIIKQEMIRQIWCVFSKVLQFLNIRRPSEFKDACQIIAKIFEKMVVADNSKLIFETDKFTTDITRCHSTLIKVNKNEINGNYKAYAYIANSELFLELAKSTREALEAIKIIDIAKFIRNLEDFKYIYAIAIKELICQDEPKSFYLIKHDIIKNARDWISELSNPCAQQEFKRFLDMLEIENATIYQKTLKEILSILKSRCDGRYEGKCLLKRYDVFREKVINTLEDSIEGLHRILVDELSINKYYFFEYFRKVIEIPERYDGSSDKYRRFLYILLLKIFLSIEQNDKECKNRINTFFSYNIETKINYITALVAKIAGADGAFFAVRRSSNPEAIDSRPIPVGFYNVSEGEIQITDKWLTQQLFKEFPTQEELKYYTYSKRREGDDGWNAIPEQDCKLKNENMKPKLIVVIRLNEFLKEDGEEYFSPLGTLTLLYKDVLKQNAEHFNSGDMRMLLLNKKGLVEFLKKNYGNDNFEQLLRKKQILNELSDHYQLIQHTWLKERLNEPLKGIDDINVTIKNCVKNGTELNKVFNYTTFAFESIMSSFYLIKWSLNLHLSGNIDRLQSERCWEKKEVSEQFDDYFEQMADYFDFSRTDQIKIINKINWENDKLKFSKSLFELVRYIVTELALNSVKVNIDIEGENQLMIEIAVAVTDTMIEIVVKDDGKGCADTLEDIIRNKPLGGLSSIQKIANSFGGELKLFNDERGVIATVTFGNSTLIKGGYCNEG